MSRSAFAARFATLAGEPVTHTDTMAHATGARYFDVVPRFNSSDLMRSETILYGGVMYKSSIGIEVPDPSVVANGDTAIAVMLIRASGTLKDDCAVGYWVRDRILSTVRSQRVIRHEHISLPADPRAGVQS